MPLSTADYFIYGVVHSPQRRLEWKTSITWQARYDIDSRWKLAYLMIADLINFTLYFLYSDIDVSPRGYRAREIAAVETVKRWTPNEHHIT